MRILHRFHRVTGNWKIQRRLPAAIVVFSLAVAMTGFSAAEDKLQFNRDIRSILSDNCFLCHGPDKNRREADLRLDIRDQAMDHQAIVPGKPDESEVVARIDSTDADVIMPPPESNKKLSDEQKALIKRWIAEGGEYQGHWAYEPPIKPATPAGVNAIDHLVGDRLAKSGLQLSPEADRRTLARRLYFDLIGLPPKPQDVEAFVADASPQAYEQLVDKLLASPQYGERMAIPWLDVVRFADTIGYHSDNPRNVWPYRDWVIKALNENKPFDQFTIEQLAGDLLPDSTQEQKVASCFNRLLLSTEEGGAQPKDYEARMLTDRVRAVGTVWLGLTLGCCQCHDHKFDPATMRDFYSLGAFFADIQEPIIGRREDGLIVPSDEQRKELDRLQAAVAELQKQLDSPPPPVVAAQEAWEKVVAADVAGDRWTVLKPEKAESEKGVKLAVDGDGVIATDRNPDGGIDTCRLTVKTQLAGITGFRLDAMEHASLPAQGPGRAGNGNFVLNEVSVTAGDKPLTIARAAATFEQPGFSAAATLDGNTEKLNGWAVMGGTGVAQAIGFELAEPLGGGEELTLVFTLQQLHGDSHTLGRFRLAATTTAKPVAMPQAGLPPQDIVNILRVEPAKRDDNLKKRLAEYFKSWTPALVEVRAKLAEAKKARADFEAALPRCIVSVSTSNPRTVRFLPRGNWMDESGEIVQPALPEFLPQPNVPQDRRLNRLDLARWLVARDNPLTARVSVNRLWKQFFGIGLSKVPDDLGSQGEWPVYPELLDWLACEFMDCGWDMKHMVRTIVLSRTYRQVSTASKPLQERDPANRTLARQSRFRLDAELVRDNALSIAGLLVPKIGGPSVKPYQPEGYWENLNFPTRTWVADTGESQYRRGLYTWWQRSFLHPSLVAFDAPSREECAADRNRSNIPQQALVLLNDPTYVEAARVFAARILKEGGNDTPARLTWAWHQALQRAPREDEVQVATALLEKHKAQYAQDAPSAGAVLKVGLAPAPQDLAPAELAAWTSVARVILNLHETVTRS
jgi:hypothetical protein